MLRFIFIFPTIVFFVISSAACQEENKKIPTFDDATTIEQIETQINSLSLQLREDVKDVESYKKSLQIMGKTNIAAGEKILKIAKTDEEQETGYTRTVDGLIMLIHTEQPTAKNKKTESQEKLNTLLGELEKQGKYLLLVNGGRFQEFIQGLEQLYEELTLEKFEQLKKDVRQWVNKQPIPFEPMMPLMIAVQFAESEKLSKIDSELAVKTIQELMTFVNSSECTISGEKKKEILEQFEGYSRRCRGTDLKLYGKTLDNQDFNWETLRGKYVLVKFTASWCGPCKSEIPGMLKAYEQYHDKGFEIVSVYVWDKLADTKHAVETEKLPWLIISEELTEKASKPPQGQTYGIQSVPTMLLVDKDGKIIDTEIRGTQLLSRLAEVFSKK
ncbi:MAG: TlpA family protein disulfide reductase [Planctomycetaceae bacterium]|jgi:thiol-disulfide isomerase/thioredoxin|nr:TlpA family protein disulfide reductase [Planctomycetaceae bacterium]